MDALGNKHNNKLSILCLGQPLHKEGRKLPLNINVERELNIYNSNKHNQSIILIDCNSRGGERQILNLFFVVFVIQLCLQLAILVRQMGRRWDCQYKRGPKGLHTTLQDAVLQE